MDVRDGRVHDGNRLGLQSVKVLITGSSGFLGQHFASVLLNGENLVQGIDIAPDPNGEPIFVEDCVRWFAEHDGHNDDGWHDYDLLIHMAGVVGGRVKIEEDPLYNADQLRIDSAMFRWAVRHAKTVVYPSSSAVYGIALQRNDAIPLHEGLFDPSSDTWLAPDEVYGLCKMAGERLALSAAKYGLNTLCIRPFSGYGEGQSMDYPVPSIARRVLGRENPLTVWGPGTQTRDFIHVSDLVGATMARLEAGVSGYHPMNVGTGVETSFNEVARVCAEIAGYEPVIENIVGKPTGVSRRFCDPTLMQRYYQPRVSLRSGLERVMYALHC